MNENRRHALVGVLVSLFVTPFIGAGLVSFLNGYAVRRGSIVGAVVGAVAGAFIGIGVSLLLTLPFFLEINAGAAPLFLVMDVLVVPMLGIVALSTVSGAFGGAIGSYVTQYTRREFGTQPAT